MDLTAVYVKVPEGYIAFVEELPGANTQGADLEEAKENLKEAVELILAENRRQAKRALSAQKRRQRNLRVLRKKLDAAVGRSAST
jgi:predicted RNase H-like HicB family nuclease